jgi:uncharacterized protein
MTDDRTRPRDGKDRRGFASMSRQKQREIASKGGRAAHEKGTAHEWTTAEAMAAGRKGGLRSRGGRGRLIGDAYVPPAPDPDAPPLRAHDYMPPPVKRSV